MDFFKKILALSLGLFVSFSQSAFTLAAPNTFWDISEQDNLYPAAHFLLERDIFRGYPDGSFGPEQAINRAELMTVMTRALHLEPDPTVYRDCFGDVKDEWFAPSVCYAKAQGWVIGYAGNVFNPARETTLGESIKIVSEPFFKQEIATLSPEEIENNLEKIKGFSLRMSAEGWYKPYVAFLKQKNVDEAISQAIGLPFNLDESLAQRGEVAELLFDYLLIKENNWNYYSDYQRDQLFLKEGRGGMVSTSYPCYEASLETTPEFILEAIKENYEVEHIRTDSSIDYEFIHDETNLPYFSLNGFCTLNNLDHKIFGFSILEREGGYEQNILQITREGGLVKNQIIPCAAWIANVPQEIPEIRLKYIDPNSYQAIDCTYGKDKDRAFVMDYRMDDNVDLQSFEPLSYPYSKDKNHAYFDSNVITEADVSTFEILPPAHDFMPIPFYAKDKNHVYLLYEVLEGADPESFEVTHFEKESPWLEGGEVYDKDFYRELFEIYLKNTYARDKNHWYLNGDIIEDIDNETFEILDLHFGKDKDHVYSTYHYSESVPYLLEGVDPDTFEPLGFWYGRDAQFIYFLDKPLLDANTENVEVFFNPYKIKDIWLKTDTEIFWGGKKITNIADLASFEFISSRYARDNEHVYHLYYDYKEEVNEYPLEIVEGVELEKLLEELDLKSL